MAKWQLQIPEIQNKEGVGGALRVSNLFSLGLGGESTIDRTQVAGVAFGNVPLGNRKS